MTRIITHMIRPAAHAAVPALGLTEIPIIGGIIRLDSFGIPYGDATIELPYNIGDDVETIDPRNNYRIIATISTTGTWIDVPPVYSDWTEVRRNLAPNPQGVGADNDGASPDGWNHQWNGGGGAAASFTSEPGGKLSRTWTVGGNNGDVFFGPVANVVEGETYSASLFVEMNYPDGLQFDGIRLRFRWRDASGDTIQDDNPPYADIEGTSVRLTVEGMVAPVGAETLYAYPFPDDPGAATPTAGTVLTASEPVIEHAPTLGGYFDGDTVGDELTQYRWTGTANASASVMETRELIAPATKQWAPAAGREFDLGVRYRAVDHARQVVTIGAQTDEARLIDYAALTRDDGAREYESSLRDVVNYVLGKIGASLEPGTADADVTAAWPLTNDIANPSFETSTDGWTGNNTSSFTTSTSAPGPNSPSYAVIRVDVAGENAYAVLDDQMGVNGGRLYSYQIDLNPDNARARGIMRWYDAAGRGIVSLYTDWAEASSGWQTVTLTAVAPANARTVRLEAYLEEGDANEVLRLDAAIFHEGVPDGYFDGATPDDALYTYEWQGTADDSVSIRTPIVERLPELFIWEPGETAWDFLQPLLNAAGLRLFCDETGAWRLVDPAEYAVPGFARLNTALVAGEDTITRQDAEVFATGVVCRYRWSDGTTERVSYDTAGTPDKVVVIDYQRPYPGPGAAAAILARRNGTGRTQEIATLTDLTITPGMEASLQLPGAPEQNGKISDIAYQLDDGALMTVGTRGLIDVPVGSWLTVPTDLAWDDIDAGESWNDWEW